MAKINIKNITLDVADVKQQKVYEEAVQRAVETISLENGFVNLIKVKVADNVPSENMRQILRQLSDRIYEQVGINNCILVPLHSQGIQDISIEKIEVVHED